MPNLPISGFASGAPAQSGDQFVIARSGANYKLIGSDIKTLIVGAGSVSIASGKTLTASNTLTFAGTDGTTMTFPSTSATLARTDAGNTFSGNQSAPQFYNPTQTLTDGATITFNANLGAVATVTVGGTGRTLTPSNLVNGGTYLLIIKQDSSGARTITTWTNFKWAGGTPPTLSTAPNAVDIVSGVSDGTYIYANIQKSFS